MQVGSVYKRGDRQSGKGVWYASYIDESGKRIVFSTGVRDKTNAQLILNQREAEVAKRRHGIIDPCTERIKNQSIRSIAEHLDEFLGSLQTAGRSEIHRKKTGRNIELAVAWCKLNQLHELTPEKIEAYATYRRQSGKSARTIQASLTALKQFSKWCVDTGRLQADPLRTVRKPNPKNDRRLRRRMILPKEWSWIAAAAKDAEERYGLSGTERLLVYRVAIETGLRASELQSLTRGKLHLTGANAFVLVPGSGTKNRKDAKQYISKTLAADLKRFIARKTSAAAVFGIRDRNRLSDAIRADLAAAKRLYIEAARSPDEKIEREADSFLAVRNEDGEELTFHSLRHTCGAWLAIQGEPVKLIQDVMRHSTVELTIGTYGHLLPMSYTQAAQRLGEMLDRVG